MEEVRCWCCEHFILEDDFSKMTDVYGICKIKNEGFFMHNKVCEFFVLRKGLHTQKIIPDYVVKD